MKAEINEDGNIVLKAENKDEADKICSILLRPFDRNPPDIIWELNHSKIIAKSPSCEE